MKLRYENVQVTGKEFISQIMRETSAIAASERKQKFSENLRNIQEEIFDKETKEYNSKLLSVIFQNIYNASPEKKRIKSVWKSEQSLHEKAKFIAKLIADNSEIPSSKFIGNIIKFIAILKTDAELKLFLANPQDYILKHPNISAHDLQILQIIINDPQFNSLPSVNRRVQPETFIYTPLQQTMYGLNLTEYGSLDAAAFPQCIYPGAEKKVLELAQKQYYGPIAKAGAGSLPIYNREIIKNTASVVNKMKMGVCNSFAQFVADHFLNLIDQGQLAPMQLKIVAYKRHVFLLVGHDTTDLNDLSNCLIIDPWSVAMGHTDTYGVYTIDNYPFPTMTKDLVCCYDNQAAVKSFEKEVSDALLKQGLFANKAAPKKELKLSVAQTAVIGFIKELIAFSPNSQKQQFFNDLIKDIVSDNFPARDAAKLAALALQSKGFEKVGENSYIWQKGRFPVDESVLPLFTSKSMNKFWQNYVKDNKLSNEENPKINKEVLDKIISHLSNNESHEYKAGCKINYNI